MSDEDAAGPEAIGRALWQSARNIDTGAAELDALLGELGEILTEEKHEGLSFEITRNIRHGNDWILTSYADVFTVKRRVDRQRGARRRLGCLVVCARLYAPAEEKDGEGWERAGLPKLFVGYEAEGRPDHWAIEHFDLGGDGTAEDLAPDGGRLWFYRDEEGEASRNTWFFCLPLAALRDREALQEQVVKPLLALIGDGDGMGDPEDAFPDPSLACRAPGQGGDAG